MVSASGTLVRLPELSSRLSVGDKGAVCLGLFSLDYTDALLQEILPNPLNLQGAYHTCQGTPTATADDTVVDVKHTVLAVCWLAVNQSVGGLTLPDVAY